MSAIAIVNGATTFIEMTLSIIGFFATLSITKLSTIMLNVTFSLVMLSDVTHIHLVDYSSEAAFKEVQPIFVERKVKYSCM